MRRSGWCYMLFFVLPTSKKFCMYDTKILQYHKCFSNNKYPWQGTSAPWPWTWHATDSAKGRPTTSTGLQVDMFICDIISVKCGRRSVQRSKNSTTKNCITKLYHIDKHGSHPSQLCLGPKFAFQVCWLNFMLRMIQACVTTFSTFLSAWVRLSGTAWNHWIAHDGRGCLKKLNNEKVGNL